MAVEVIMPKMEMAQEAGTVVRWLKAEGSTVRQGEPLLEIETDKVTMEIEAPGSGLLAQVRAHDGDEVPVGQVIALIVSPGEEAKGPPPAAAQVAVNPVSQAEASADAAARKTAAPARLTPASPLARRLAQESGVNITKMPGSGPEGAVMAADVRAAVSQVRPAAEIAYPAAEPYRVIPLRGVRKVVASRMQQSFQTAPHVALSLSVDMTEARRLMEHLAEPVQREVGRKLGPTAAIARVAALALKRHPRLNAHLADQEIREFENVHLGIAVALEEGLVVPVIRNAHSKGLSAIQGEMDDLAHRARSGELKLEEIKGSTFTISNLGMYGIEQFTAILNPPEVGLLAVGAMKPGAVEVGGQMTMRPLLRLTLMADHRAVDGAVGAEFLATLKEMLENPYILLA